MALNLTPQKSASKADSARPSIARQASARHPHRYSILFRTLPRLAVDAHLSAETVGDAALVPTRDAIRQLPARPRRPADSPLYSVPSPRRLRRGRPPRGELPVDLQSNTSSVHVLDFL
jgi:hypothetical protein